MSETPRRGRPPAVRDELKFNIKLTGKRARRFSAQCVKQGKTQSAAAEEGIELWLLFLDMGWQKERKP